MKLVEGKQIEHYISKLAALSLLLQDSSDHIILLKRENRELKETIRELLARTASS